MTELENFTTHLQSLNLSDWDKLFALLPEIEQTQKFGETVVIEGQMPYIEEAKIVRRFHDTMYGLGLIIIFDWAKWTEGREMLHDKNLDFTQLDTTTLCKLLTTISRADRFSEGFLVVNFENGIILKILKALQNNISK